MVPRLARRTAPLQLGVRLSCSCPRETKHLLRDDGIVIVRCIAHVPARYTWACCVRGFRWRNRCKSSRKPRHSSTLSYHGPRPRTHSYLLVRDGKQHQRRRPCDAEGGAVACSRCSATGWASRRCLKCSAIAGQHPACANEHSHYHRGAEIVVRAHRSPTFPLLAWPGQIILCLVRLWSWFACMHARRKL